MDKKLEKYYEWYKENTAELIELQEAKKRIFAEIRKAKDMQSKLTKWIKEKGGEVEEQLDLELEDNENISTHINTDNGEFYES